MSQSVAAIVPAYNEAETIRDVVGALKRSPLLSEVIVVSDGSTDATAEAARSAGAQVIKQPNKGKGAAVLTGLAATDAPIIALFDADLIGLTPDHVDRLLEPVLSGARAMNCGLRDRGWFTGITAHLPLVSGERAMKREVLEKIPPRFLQGFTLESALNYFCRANGLSYGAVQMPGLTIRRKYQKVGWKKGLVQYAHMTVQVAFAMIQVRIARLTGTFSYDRSPKD